MYDNLFVIIAFAIWEDARATDLLSALVRMKVRDMNISSYQIELTRGPADAVVTQTRV